MVIVERNESRFTRLARMTHHFSMTVKRLRLKCRPLFVTSRHSVISGTKLIKLVTVYRWIIEIAVIFIIITLLYHRCRH